MLILFGIFLPYQGILIPLVQVLTFFHLYGSIPGLIFVHCVFGIPITALIFRSYYVTVPRDLLDAGRIDGAGFFGLYWWIMLPIAAPAFAVALIWQFTNIWNDFLLGVVVLSNPRLAPITVAINNITGSYSVEWNLQMAAAIVAAAPTVIVYLLTERKGCDCHRGRFRHRTCDRFAFRRGRALDQLGTDLPSFCFIDPTNLIGRSLSTPSPD
jgi:glucose/mannose transport system permease protein